MIENAKWDVVEHQLAVRGVACSEFRSTTILSQNGDRP